MQCKYVDRSFELVLYHFAKYTAIDIVLFSSHTVIGPDLLYGTLLGASRLDGKPRHFLVFKKMQRNLAKTFCFFDLHLHLARKSQKSQRPRKSGPA